MSASYWTRDRHLAAAHASRYVEQGIAFRSWPSSIGYHIEPDLDDLWDPAGEPHPRRGLAVLQPAAVAIIAGVLFAGTLVAAFVWLVP